MESGISSMSTRDRKTLFPFDTEALDIPIMTEKEIEWLNSYHEMVYDRLSPMLDEEEQQWLHRKTTAI